MAVVDDKGQFLMANAALEGLLLTRLEGCRRRITEFWDLTDVFDRPGFASTLQESGFHSVDAPALSGRRSLAERFVMTWLGSTEVSANIGVVLVDAATATASTIATIDDPGSPVQWSSDFSAAGLNAINRTGTT